jgi:hypothetical protein
LRPRDVRQSGNLNRTVFRNSKRHGRCATNRYRPPGATDPDHAQRTLHALAAGFDSKNTLLHPLCAAVAASRAGFRYARKRPAHTEPAMLLSHRDGFRSHRSDFAYRRQMRAVLLGQTESVLRADLGYAVDGGLEIGAVCRAQDVREREGIDRWKRMAATARGAKWCSFGRSVRSDEHGLGHDWLS